MTTRVTVVDYGLGNIHSVVKALVHVGAEPHLTADPADIPGADRLIVPGVGAFADGARGLEERGLVEPVLEYVESGRPFLGICVGMQLLLSESQEFGRHAGLGVIPGRVIAIPRTPGLKVPQIGWNRIFPPQGRDWRDSLLADLEPDVMLYFVHSFTAHPEHEEHRLADADYGGHRISAVVHRDNVWGCQFHPEKSGEAGLQVLRRFLCA